jgi:hypothetical protein
LLKIDWLNDYYKKIREHVGDYLKEKKHFEIYEYLLSKTEAFEYKENAILVNNSVKKSKSFSFIILAVFISKYFF